MIEIDEFVERLCRLCAHKGPRRFPRKPRGRAILMKSIVMGLDSSAQYTEPEISTRLAEWSENVATEIEVDVTTLRRLMVDRGELERTRDRAIYEVGFSGRPVAFALEIEELDLRATVAAYLDGTTRGAADPFLTSLARGVAAFDVLRPQDTHAE